MATNPTDAQLVQRLMELGRKDVLSTMTNYNKRLNWYNKYGVKEYPDFWTATRADQINRNAPATTTAPVKSLAQKYVESVLPKGGVQNSDDFLKLIPRESIVNKDLINQFAFSQINPEYDRLKSIGMQDLGVQQNQTGQFRFGSAMTDQQRLADQYERARKDAANPFALEAEQRLGSYYDTLYDEYKRDPNAFQYKPLDVNQYLTNTPTTQPVPSAQSTLGNLYKPTLGTLSNLYKMA